MIGYNINCAKLSRLPDLFRRKIFNFSLPLWIQDHDWFFYFLLIYFFIQGAEALAESNALACWLCGMLSCFGGKIVANFLLGQPVIAAFNSTKHIITATIVWYDFIVLGHVTSFAYLPVLPSPPYVVPVLDTYTPYPTPPPQPLSHSDFCNVKCNGCFVLLL